MKNIFIPEINKIYSLINSPEILLYPSFDHFIPENYKIEGLYGSISTHLISEIK